MSENTQNVCEDQEYNQILIAVICNYVVIRAA